jgi:hypothetical protein
MIRKIIWNWRSDGRDKYYDVAEVGCNFNYLSDSSKVTRIEELDNNIYEIYSENGNIVRVFTVNLVVRDDVSDTISGELVRALSENHNLKSRLGALGGVNKELERKISEIEKELEKYKTDMQRIFDAANLDVKNNCVSDIIQILEYGKTLCTLGDGRFLHTVKSIQDLVNRSNPKKEGEKKMENKFGICFNCGKPFEEDENKIPFLFSSGEENVCVDCNAELNSASNDTIMQEDSK